MGLRERCIRRRENKRIRATLGDQEQQGYPQRDINDSLLNASIQSNAHSDPSFQEQHRSRKWSRLIKIRAEIFAKLYNERQKPS